MPLDPLALLPGVTYGNRGPEAWFAEIEGCCEAVCPCTAATGGAGIPGPAGPPGPTGPTGAPLEYAMGYALMPPDNAATIAPGAAVQFPHFGPATGGFTRIGNDTYQLDNIGDYEIFFQVSVDEPGQLVVGHDAINGSTEVANTVAGRATGTSQITNDVIIRNTIAPSFVTIRNPTGNASALTITPIAGGTHPVTATIIIKRLS